MLGSRYLEKEALMIEDNLNFLDWKNINCGRKPMISISISIWIYWMLQDGKEANDTYLLSNLSGSLQYEVKIRWKNGDYIYEPHIKQFSSLLLSIPCLTFPACFDIHSRKLLWNPLRPTLFFHYVANKSTLLHLIY